MKIHDKAADQAESDRETMNWGQLIRALRMGLITPIARNGGFLSGKGAMNPAVRMGFQGNIGNMAPVKQADEDGEQAWMAVAASRPSI